MALTIGQVADAADVNIKTIRYYERRGLFPTPRRPPTGYRQYADDAVARLRFIKHAQELGFSLQEIQELLGLRVRHGAACDAVERKTRHKIEVVQQRIRALQRMKRTQRSPLWPPPLLLHWSLPSARCGRDAHLRVRRPAAWPRSLGLDRPRAQRFADKAREIARRSGHRCPTSTPEDQPSVVRNSHHNSQQCSDPSARLGRHLSQRSKGAATTPTTRRGPAGRAVINDRALLDARSQMRSREERTRAPVRPASVALLVPVVSGGVQIA